MKAWRVFRTCPRYFELIFAETEDEAKKLALSTYMFEYSKLIELRAKRMEKADRFYEEGKWHLNWNDMMDKKALLEIGWGWLGASRMCAKCDRRDAFLRWDEVNRVLQRVSDAAEGQEGAK